MVTFTARSAYTKGYLLLYVLVGRVSAEGSRSASLGAFAARAVGTLCLALRATAADESCAEAYTEEIEKGGLRHNLLALG